MKLPTYETETCSRCGGSGHYSYNQMTGTRCFKCIGEKVVYTKRGAAARQFADELRKLPVSEIKVGDRIYWGKGGRMTVVAVSEPFNSGFGRSYDGGKTFVRELDSVTVSGATMKQVFTLTNSVRRGWTEEMVDQVNAYQNNLTKAGKLRKRATT